jgi:hypothetical protein
MRARIRIVAVLVLALAAGPAAAAPTDPVYPDLVSDPPEAPFIETYVTGGTERLLLRMDGFVHNAGFGALEVDGNPQVDAAHPQGDVHQVVYRGDGTHFALTPLLPVVYESNDDHHHFHLMRASEYSLWNAAKTAQVAPAEKVGFCLYDIEHVETDRGPSRWHYDGGGDFCRQYNPGATTLDMGVSAGWRDTYGAHLELQWVDISNTAPGQYWLAARVDPQNIIVEQNEANNGLAFAGVRSIVPGHLAQPVGPVDVPFETSTQVVLAATTYSGSGPGEAAGERRFRIVDAPDHGTLDRATGVVFSTDRVIYTPNPGYSGPDTFSFVALSASSLYPLTPPQAAASLVVGAPTPSVAISGAPAALALGTSAQLVATVSGAAPGVTWSVNGVAGGDATVGTVSSDGLYVAPDSVPPGGSVTIRATSVAAPEAFDEATIAITPPPAVGVAIVGAPASLPVGATAGLSATVTGAGQGVVWSVNGVEGGNGTVGTISPSGTYTAPASVPPGGSVTMRATSVAAPGAFGEATIVITPASVAISGYPASLVVGTSVQLQATVAGASGAVTWSVDGVPGGDATRGTITASGLYVAPSAVPQGGTVRIRATSVAAPAAFGEVVVTIAPQPPQVAAPRPPVVDDRIVVQATPRPVPVRLSPASRSRTRVAVRGGWLAVHAIAPDTGILRLRATASGRTLLRCSAAATRGREVTCAARLARPVPAGSVRVALGVDRRGRSADLLRPRLQLRVDGWLSASVIALEPGRVSLRVTQGTRTLLRCSARMPDRRPLSCGSHVHGVDSTGLRLVASVRTADRLVVSRR